MSSYGRVAVSTVLLGGLLGVGPAFAEHNHPKSTKKVILPLVRAFPTCESPTGCLLGNTLTQTCPIGSLKGYCSVTAGTSCTSDSGCPSGEKCLRLVFGPKGQGTLTLAAVKAANGLGATITASIKLKDVQTMDDTGATAPFQPDTAPADPNKIQLYGGGFSTVTSDHCATDPLPGGTCTTLDTPSCEDGAGQCCSQSGDTILSCQSAKTCDATHPCKDFNWPTCVCTTGASCTTISELIPSQAVTCAYNGKGRTDCKGTVAVGTFFIGPVDGDSVTIDSVVISDPAYNDFLKPGLFVP
jgi:hypothetical protein